MITKTTLNKIKELEDMAVWLRDEVMDEDNWELNAVALQGRYDKLCRQLLEIIRTNDYNEEYLLPWHKKS